MNPLFVTAAVYGGKKITEKITPAMLKEGCRLVFQFAQNDEKEHTTDGKEIILNRRVEILENDLSVPKNFMEKQIVRIGQDISDELAIIKGQNEILFLSNSIDYFLKAHNSRTGIDRAISYSLQYDIKAVLNHVRKTPEIRFPGYMLHQTKSLGSTIKEYNLFYDSLLNDGHVVEWTKQDVVAELEKTFGPDRQPSPVRRYMPYEYQIKWLRQQAKRKGSSWIDRLPLPMIFGSGQEVLDEAHDSLVILQQELIANEALEQSLLTKLSHIPTRRLIVRSELSDYAEKRQQ